MRDDDRTPGVMRLPGGTVVHARGLRGGQPPEPPPEHGLYLLGRAPDPATGTVRITRWPRRTFRPDWPATWVRWPDFRTPTDPEDAARAIRAAFALARAGRRVEVACGGGVGRTGTALACMAVLAGVPAGQAVAWVRLHHRPRAVETPGQRAWVRWFAAWAGRP